MGEEYQRLVLKILVSGKQYVAYPKCLKHSISDILFFCKPPYFILLLFFLILKWWFVTC